MNSEKNISRGGLSGKMDGFRPDPPESVWEGIAAGLQGKRSGRRIFILLGAAAGLALALTVGITLLTNPAPEGIATLEESSGGASPAAANTNPSAAVSNTNPSAAAKTEASSGDTGIPGRSEALTDRKQQDGVEAGAPGRSEVFADGKLQNTGDEGVEDGKTRTENVSRLEQRVIGAMQEVINEQTIENERIAGRTQTTESGNTQSKTDGTIPVKQTGEDPSREPVNGQDIPSGNGQDIPSGNGQDNPSGNGQDIPSGNDQLQSEQGIDNKVVNEDSLLRVLKEDAGASGEQEILVATDHQSGKWQLGASLSPLISYRDVAAADAAQNAAVNQSESARLTYAGGVGVSYLPSDRITIQTGVYYNKMGVNIGEYSSFKSGWFESAYDMVSTPGRSESVVSISNSMGTVISGDEERFVNNYTGTETLTDYHMLRPEEMIVADASVESFSQTFEYLEIPFNVRYKIIDRSVDLQIMGGFSTNFLVNNSVAAIAGDQTVAIGKVEDVRMFNYSGNAGLGIVYNIFENFSFSVEPRFRYYLNSVNTPELPVTRPYTFGLYTGVNYKF